MRRPATLLIVVLLALLAGCGGSGETRTAPQDDHGGASSPSVRLAWERNPDCRPAPGASRWGCSVGSYRCQGVVTGRGWSISCSKPGRSLGFTVPRDS
ncbi:MAG TPA: hypothetical protein VJU14_02660 [Solirubrobacterales bacterium]|nr:hypothetical protein [Solirubrobacterales bacterium]